MAQDGAGGGGGGGGGGEKSVQRSMQKASTHPHTHARRRWDRKAETWKNKQCVCQKSAKPDTPFFRWLLPTTFWENLTDFKAGIRLSFFGSNILSLKPAFVAKHFSLLWLCPTKIGTTRVTPTATQLVVISDGGIKIWVALGCSKGSFYFRYFNASSGFRTTRH